MLFSSTGVTKSARADANGMRFSALILNSLRAPAGPFSLCNATDQRPWGVGGGGVQHAKLHMVITKTKHTHKKK